MRKHSEEFKNKINLIGRELDSKLTFGETELGNDQLNAVTPVLQSSLLKSVMKELDIDSNVDIPVGTIVNYKFGVLLDSGDYEYLDYGNYQIYSSEKQEDNNAYNIVAYDKMLNSMVEYTKLKKENVKFPISVRDYITYLCEDIGLVFKNQQDEFVNYNRMIESDLYAGLGYTYRDIFDELAQVTASNIIINENDEIEIKYITSTGEIETTSSNNNNIIEVDNIPKQNARSLIVYGNSFQEIYNSKNILNMPEKNYSYNGSSITMHQSEIVITGNEAGNSAFAYNSDKQKINLELGSNYTYSVYQDDNNKWDSGSFVFKLRLHFDDGTYEDIVLAQITSPGAKKVYKSFTPSQDVVAIHFIGNTYAIKGLNTPATFKLQVEPGEESTDYEPCYKIPSPEFPSEIKCVQGNLQLVDTGKNMFDINNPLALNYGSGSSSSAGTINSDGTITTSRNFSSSRAKGTPVELEKNTDYIISIFVNSIETDSNKQGRLELLAYNNDDSFNHIIHSSTFTKIGETVSISVNSEDCEKYAVHISGYYGLGYTGNLIYSQPMVRKADTNDEYEPYQKTETYIDIGNNKLCKINDVADEHDIVTGKGIRRIGECVLTGDESIIFEKDGYIRARIKIDNSSKEGSRQPILSNYFKYALAVNDEGTGFMANGCFYFYLPKEYTTKEQYTQWLKDRYNEGNPVIFKWILETPQEFTTEPVNIQLRKGYNRIEINDKNELINKLDLTYQLDDDTIDEEYLKDVNVKFGEKYGPINSIVLSRSAGADNIYLQDEQSVAENGLCELKISDNQIMNFNDRSDYLPDILNKLNGLEYYINDFSSTGICYYEIADRYNVKVFDNTYPCIMFNDEIDVSQGLVENIHTDLPEQAETDYTKADKTDRKINQTYIIVDKQNQTIESVVSQTDTFNERITKNEQDVEGIRQLVEGVYDYTREASGNNKLTIEQSQEGNLLELHITGEVELLYPQDDLYPEDTLYPLDSYLIVENDKGEKRKFHLPNDNNYLYLYTYNDISDEFVIENIYNENTKEYERRAKIIRRVKVEADGTRSRLIDPITEDYGIVNITLFKGKNTIYLESFEGLNYYVKYAIINEIIDEYATKVELSTEITQTEKQIQSVARAKVDSTEIISTINQSAEAIKINADKIELTAGNVLDILTNNEINLKTKNITIKSDNFNVDGSNFSWKATNSSMTNDGTLTAKNANITGTVTTTNGNIGGFNITANSLEAKMTHIFPDMTADDVEKIRQYLLGHVTLTSAEQEKYDLNKDGVVSLIDMQMARQIQVGSISKNYTGYFKINTNDMQKTITLSGLNNSEAIKINMFGNITCSSLKVSSITCESISMLQDITSMIRRDAVDSAYLEVTFGGYGSYGIDMWSSDKRLKENIEDTDYKALDKIMSIKHRKFDFKKGGHIENGYIADELEEIDSKFIFEVGEEKMKQPRIDTLIPAITKAIQEQQEIINNLKEEIDILNKKINVLESNLKSEQ